MNVHLSFDRKKPVRVASETEWRNLVNWAMRLPNRLYPNFVHLVYYGFSRNVSMISNEMIDANKRYQSKDSQVILAIKNMISIMNLNRNSEVAIISNGPIRESEKNPPIRR